ncbi:hypothetical protein BDV36DRAFT_264130 [Aspergillus pseudocaelatus]|uniref:Uncharacterized protein n=1 Tax=Aspergillus pseudocaelatus TaxID=1825620 RepID=A0ABQ6WCK4_9EURO|nr:hypothetical protein BDV36DRAFT_264130 [Aspergillus pseudocaelatus]
MLGSRMPGKRRVRHRRLSPSDHFLGCGCWTMIRFWGFVSLFLVSADHVIGWSRAFYYPGWLFFGALGCGMMSDSRVTCYYCVCELLVENWEASFLLELFSG